MHKPKNAKYYANLDYSERHEQAFERYLLASGYSVVPAYSLGGKFAPMLNYPDGGTAPIPDLLTFMGPNRPAWFEVKVKSGAVMNRQHNVLVTGIDLRHWQAYQTVRERTGLPVNLIFMHEKENEVRWGEIGTIPVVDIYHDDKIEEGGMVFFRYEGITLLSQLGDFLFEWSEHD